ncbi:MAG TPA: glycosyltransferase family 4 protein [Sphingomonas sp.]|jgi:glycosyltransferase involved in cell wall biosynthesis|uniref:glycosyltransferase family 4 protein n=1 Tax=Sphingomonas sp. TaxID=28214 RepID=UPI002EDB2F2B
MNPIRILHLHSTFALGGKEARAVRLMNAFGAAATHVVLSAMPDQMGAQAAIADGIGVTFPDDAPSLQGKPAPARYWRLARYMAGFDLVLTYNWGAMDAVMARRIHAPVLRMPPIVHHEDGFNADETQGQKPKRVWFRRLGLGAVDAVVVPSRRLEAIAGTIWKQPAVRIHRIANGIAVDHYGGPPAPLPGFAPMPGDVVIGTIAGLRAVKDLPRLVRAVAALPAHVRLLIVGEGPERAAITAEAARLGIAGRVHLAGFHARPAAVLGHFDIFALSSESEQFPISVLEAMAAGLPVAAPDVGDVATMVAGENRRFVVGAADPDPLASALATLADDPVLRTRLGAANRAVAEAVYREDAMIAAYHALYERVARRPIAL